MDIVYVLSSNISQWQDNEIRYSLRSLNKYGLHYDRIFLIGGKPDFLDYSKIQYFKFIDDYSNNDYSFFDYNVFKKLIYLCDNSDITNDFIVFNDDFYLLDIIDFLKLPYYFKNIQISLKYFKNNSFNEMAIRTRQFLFEKGKSFYDFKVHYPIIYNKVKLRYLIPLFKESFKNSGLGLSLRDLYGNWHNVSDKVFMEDNKIGINERYFDYYLKKFNLISGSNDPSDYEKEFLIKKYYKKSKWEL